MNKGMSRTRRIGRKIFRILVICETIIFMVTLMSVVIVYAATPKIRDFICEKGMLNGRTCDVKRNFR